jgi:ribosome-associated protein
MTKTPSPEMTRDLILQALEDNKAEDIVTIDLNGKSSIADYMIIASGRSSRHVVGLSNHITEAIAQGGGLKAKFDGKDNGDWVLGDAGDVIVHLFRPEVREFYNIEKIWCDPEFLESFQASKERASAPLAEV